MMKQRCRFFLLCIAESIITLSYPVLSAGEDSVFFCPDKKTAAGSQKTGDNGF